VRSMPKVKVSSQSKHSVDETFRRVKNFLENNDELRQLDAKYECEFNEPNLSGKVTGEYFKAFMTIQSEGDGSNIDIVVELNFALILFKHSVQKKLQDKLDQVLQS